MIKNNWMKKIEILVWDLDGTLVKPNKAIEKTMKEKMLQKLSVQLQVSKQEAQKRFNKRVKKIKGTTLTIDSFGIDGFKIIAEMQKEIVWEKYIQEDQKSVKMLKNLKNYRHLLLTDNTKTAGLKKLSLLGVNPDIFEKKFFGIDLRVTKPKLELFQKVLDYTEIEPEKHLMIGDVVEKDIVPAKKIGMRTCLVWSKSEKADLSLKTVYQLGDLLR